MSVKDMVIFRGIVVMYTNIVKMYTDGRVSRKKSKSVAVPNDRSIKTD